MKLRQGPLDGRLLQSRSRCAAALGVVLAADAAAYATLIYSSSRGTARTLEGISAVCWIAGFVLLARLRLTGRAVAALVLGGGLVLGVVAITRAPSTSTDANRYIWDAKVQLAGVDPYRYAPSSPALERLRDPSLFGAPEHCQYRFRGGCTSINRPTVHTIYPPVAEGAFTLVRLVSFGGQGGRLPLQIAALLGSLAIGWLLLRWGGARGRPWIAAVWMWCPTVLTDLVNNAHIDWLAVLLVVLALGTPVSRRTGWAAALVGAAIATKLYPVLVLASLLRRRPVLAVASAVGVVVLVYIPHVLAVGSAVIGYLPGYLQEEQYSSGSRLLLIGSVLPHPFDTGLGVVLVLAVLLWAVAVGRRDEPPAPEHSAVVVFGVVLLVFTPNYGWYMALLVALVAMTQAWEWIPLCVAGTFAYLSPVNARWWYLGAAVLTLMLLAIRRGWTVDSLRECLQSISPTTDRSRSSRSTRRP